MLEHAVELGKINLAEDDPDVLLTAYELGRVLQQSDDPMAARRVLEEAYAAGQWRLGDSDPLMLQISHDIGAVAEELGNRHEARKAFSRVAELGPQALGAGHWAVARARAYLGSGPSDVRPEPDSAQPGGDAPTTVIEAVRPGTVQPPSVDNQHVWTRPAEPVAQPIIAPHARPEDSPPTYPSVPAQRSEPTSPESGAPSYPAMPSSGSAYPSAAAWPAPQPGTYGDGQVFAPAYPSGGLQPYGQGSAAPSGRRGLGIFAAIAAGLAAVIAVAALVFVLADRASDSPDNDNVPNLAGPAPSDVKLRDAATTVTVSWKDPTEASVSFMVIMGRPGLELKPVGTLGPGQTSFEMSGLNPTVNYCFAVVAVYSGDQFATSPQACTSRASATPR